MDLIGREFGGRAGLGYFEVAAQNPYPLTSNRDVAEWIPLFDDPILAQSALDRLAHNAHQVVIEGESFRKRQSPGAGDRKRRAQPPQDEPA